MTIVIGSMVGAKAVSGFLSLASRSNGIPKGHLFSVPFRPLNSMLGLPARVDEARRVFQIQAAPPADILERMERDGAVAQFGVTLAVVTSSVYMPIVMLALGIGEATPFVRHAYENKFHALEGRSGFYIALALFAFSAQWSLSELRRARGKLGREGHRIAFYECCFSVYRCLKAYRGEESLLVLDRRNKRLGTWLVRFGAHGAGEFSPRRQQQLREHTARVSAALDAYNERILREGVDAIPELVGILFVILNRMAQGQWLNLMDDGDLPPYIPPTAEEIDSETRRADAAIVVGGATVAAVFTGVAISLGVPASAVVPAALIFLLGPATLWGSKKLGNPKEALESFRQGTVQSSDPAPSSSAAGTAANPPQ
ncbi:hypothetical protein [Streptomyces sp. NPDC090080]|uniref:hypothetical protein n=1 Tax=Streptomyces sp. NPDC090080 TaxID=3365939 RepID=UPI0038009F65